MGVFEKQKGSGVWWILYHDANGQRHREVVGTKTAAKAAYEKRKTQIREGKFFPESMNRRRVTVAEAIDEYLERAEARLRHFYHYKRFGKNWKAAIGSKPLATVTPGDVSDFIRHLGNRLSPASINRHLAFLKKVFSDSVLNGLVHDNPVKKVKLLKENNQRTRYLTWDEQEKLVNALPDSEFYAEAVIFALNTGLRQTEQFRLQWRDVDFLTRTITIRDHKSGGAPRFVKMNDVVLAILEAIKPDHSKPGGLVFPFNSHNFYNRIFKPTVEKLGLEGVVWHTLRHTFASRLVVAGVNIKEVQRLLGHKSLRMTERYTHLSDDSQQAAVDRLVQPPKQPPAALVGDSGWSQKAEIVCVNADESGGGQGVNRTLDTRIFSPLLYRLSYLPTVTANRSR
jgi:integrase